MKILGGFLPSTLYVMCLNSVVRLLQKLVQKYDDQAAINITSDIFSKIGK